MSFSDYLIDIALIGVVLLQIRGRRLTARALLLPVVLVAVAARSYLTTVPTAGNDLLLVVVLSGAGVVLGGASGIATRVHRGPDGVAVARAGATAAGLWILGMGFRLAFQLYATYGGAAAIGRFSVAHDITSGQAWVAALVLMAILEALSRTAVLGVRAATGRDNAGAGAGSGIMAVGERLA